MGCDQANWLPDRRSGAIVENTDSSACGTPPGWRFLRSPTIFVSVHSLLIDRVRTDPERNDCEEPLPDERVLSVAPRIVRNGPEVAKRVR
jgi:hypothetical protein